MASANEEIRRRNKDAAQRAALFWIELANQRQSEIIRQLLGLSAVLLPLSASIILSNTPLDITEKYLLTSSWILFLISIIAGFIQIQIDSKYFVLLSRDSSKREELWSDSNRSVPTIEKEVASLGKVPGASTSLPQYIQAVTFFIGLILVAIVGALILFDTSRSKQSPNRLNWKTHDFFWKSYKNR